MHKRFLTSAILAVLAALLLAPTAAADTGSDAPDPRIVAALERIADDTYTQDDLELIRSHPTIAAQVPDPTTPAEVGSDSGQTSAASHDVGPLSSYWVDVWFRKKSLLGTTIYVWHHRVAYDTSGNRITNWNGRSDYLTEADSIIYVRELVANSKSRLPRAGSAESFRQRHLEYCVVKVGCYANTYPRSRITVYPNGDYDYNGSAT